MNYYVGIDVSLEASSVCVVDGNGKIVREGEVASEPEALIAWLKGLKLELMRIGLEAGPLSQWLYAAMRQAGLAVELLESRDVRNALKMMPVKDRPQRRARNRAADAAGLVPPGALQVDRSAGEACAAHRTQAGAGKTS
jgi:transposase